MLRALAVVTALVGLVGVVILTPSARSTSRATSPPASLSTTTVSFFPVITEPPTTEPPTTTTEAPPVTTKPPPPPPPAPYNPPGDVWWQLALCESGGNPAISTGNGYYGAFQFLPSTWWSVGGTGYPHEHSYETQLHFAQVLQARSGWGQWPGCAHKLGLL